MLIALDAGHGMAGDPGAINVELQLNEADCVAHLREIALKKLRPYPLEMFYPNRELPSYGRAQEARRKGCGVLLSLHLNAAERPEASGFELWFHHGNDRGRSLAMEIAGSLSLVLRGRGVKDDLDWHPPGDPLWQEGMGILRGFPGPAAVIELLFLSNPEEARLLLKPDFCEQAVDRIVQGLVGFLHLTPELFWDLEARDREIACLLHTKGILRGFPDGSFRPEEPLKRLDGANMLSRLLDYLEGR